MSNFTVICIVLVYVLVENQPVSIVLVIINYLYNARIRSSVSVRNLQCLYLKAMQISYASQKPNTCDFDNESKTQNIASFLQVCYLKINQYT